MSAVRTEQVKRFLRIIHNSDDQLLQELIDAAEEEALTFLDRASLPRPGSLVVDEADSNALPEPVSDSNDLAPAVRGAIYLLVQAMYEGVDAQQMKLVREAAEVKLMPFRNNLGV